MRAEWGGEGGAGWEVIALNQQAGLPVFVGTKFSQKVEIGMQWRFSWFGTGRIQILKQDETCPDLTSPCG